MTELTFEDVIAGINGSTAPAVEDRVTDWVLSSISDDVETSDHEYTQEWLRDEIDVLIDLLVEGGANIADKKEELTAACIKDIKRGEAYGLYWPKA